MKTDGLFTLRRFDVPNWQINRPLRLIPFSDVHRDSPAHSKDKWEEFLEYTRGLKDAVFIGLGDYMDAYSPSERAIVYDPRLHDSTVKRNEEEAAGRIEKLAGELDHMRGRLIGLCGGNHYVQFSNGTTGDMLLAGKLGCEYLGACCFVRLQFPNVKGRSSARAGIDIFAHHGRGAGVTAAGKFLAVERMTQIAEADIYLQGHNHARGTFPLGDKLRLAANDKGHLYLRSRHAWIGRTGAFLKAYEPGESSYVVDGAMPPSNLGWIEFILTPRRNREGGTDTMTVEIKAVQ